jgi:hypothetical protein
MTVGQLIERLQELVQHGLSEDAAVMIHDADAGGLGTVGGFLYDHKEVTLCPAGYD